MIFEETVMDIAFAIAAIILIFIKYIMPFVGLIISVYWLNKTKNKKWYLLMAISIIWLIISICCSLHSWFLIRNLSLISLLEGN
jgi:hypothetical protein